jgi:hypothetical protein
VTEAAAVEATGQSDPADLRTIVARLGAVLEEEVPDRRVIRFPMGRNVGMAGFLGLFALFWAGLVAMLFASDAPRYFPWAGAAAGVLIGYSALHALFGVTRLVYSTRGIEYAHGLFGWGRLRDVPRTRVRGVSVRKSGSKMGSTAYQNLVTHTDDGDVTLVKELAHLADAEALAADIRRVLELDAGKMPLDAELPGEFLSEKQN